MPNYFVDDRFIFLLLFQDMLRNLSPTTNSIIVNPTHTYEERQIKNELDTAVEQPAGDAEMNDNTVVNKFYDVPSTPNQPGKIARDYLSILLV